MTLFEELGIEYREENGIQYPVLSVDTEGMRLDDVGKYGAHVGWIYGRE